MQVLRQTEVDVTLLLWVDACYFVFMCVVLWAVMDAWELMVESSRQWTHSLLNCHTRDSFVLIFVHMKEQGGMECLM